MAEEPRRRLGRGLATLLGDAATETTSARGRAPRRAPIEFLRPNPRNPRTTFGEAELADLTASIREKGIIQPIIVRSLSAAEDVYEIIAGERRWRAAQAAGLSDVPIVVQEASDREALELAIIENVQRADLNAVEEARGYQRLGAEFGYSQGEIARIIGKSRAHVANTLRLLNLPESVARLVQEGAISAGHARALLSVDDPEAVAKRIVAEGLTVRDVEALSAARLETPVGGASGSGGRKTGAPEKDADTRAMEKALSDALGLRVSIHHQGEAGEVRIRYARLEQLDAICRLLTV
jgi:ParB family chromosome partitioning protein